MSGLQRVDPIAQRLIASAAASGKDCSYSKSTKDVLGRVVEQTTIEVLGGVVHVSESDRRPPVLGDWLAVIGAGTLVILSLFLFFQAVKGVIRSEKSTGNSIEHVADGIVVGVELRGGLRPRFYG